MDVISEMMGVPEEDRAEVRRQADIVVHREDGVYDVPQAGAEASLWLVVYYQAMVDQRRKQPSDDLTSALIGVATVPAVWLAARELFREQRATVLATLPLLAAFLSAVSYWHLNWSRVGLRVILVPLFAALIVFALWRGFNTDRPDRWRPPVRSSEV